MCRDNVHIALDDYGPTVASDCTRSLVQRVEQAALVVNRRLRRVDVLRVAIVQGARAEPDDPSLLIVYRKHQAAAETIVYATFSLYEQARPQKLFIAKPALSQ